MRLWMLFLTALLMHGQQRPATPAPPPAAVVASVTGEVWLIEDGARRRVSNHEWLPGGASLELESGALAQIIMIDGQRYDLGGGASIKLATGGVTIVRGPVTKGTKLPPIPVVPIAAPAPRQSGAVRIRGQRITGLNPCIGIRTVADTTSFRFDAVIGAARYEVGIFQDARPIYTSTTSDTTLNLPPGVLAPGTGYTWTVRAIGRTVAAEGTGKFATLDDRTEAARRELIEALEREREWDLIAVINSRLGLLNEAVAALTEALERDPSDRSRVSLQRARDALRTACE